MAIPSSTKSLVSMGMMLFASRYVAAFTPSHLLRSAVGRSVSVLKAESVASTAESTVSDTDFDATLNTKVAFMFPGQGAQFVGMCASVVQDVPKAKELFDEASAILGYDLLAVCTEGPKEKLDSTVVSQPAIFVASMAAGEKLRQEQGDAALDAATCAMG